MRKGISFAASMVLATALLHGQEEPPPPPPIPGEEAPRAIPVKPAPEVEPKETTAPDESGEEQTGEAQPQLQAVRLPLGVKAAKPKVPTTEKLIRDSEDALVEGDSMWMTIEHERGRGITTVDVGRDGLCFLIERKIEDGKVSPMTIRGGRGVPEAVRKRILELSRQKGVLYGLGRDRLVTRSGSERMRLGVAANYGRSVHSSQSVPFDEFPAELRHAATALLEAARTLPVAKTAKGVVSAEFVPPYQARRLTVLGGQRLIAVRDPGKEATLLPPVVAAARMPGRRVVVLDELHWEQIRSYLTAGGLKPDTGGAGQCLISVGAQTYRLFVEPVGW